VSGRSACARVCAQFGFFGVGDHLRQSQVEHERDALGRVQGHRALVPLDQTDGSSVHTCTICDLLQRQPKLSPPLREGRGDGLAQVRHAATLGSGYGTVHETIVSYLEVVRVASHDDESNCFSDEIWVDLSLLTAQDVAELLQVKIGWIYDQVEAGNFPVIRLGRQLRFRATEIQAYLDERQRDANPRRHLQPIRPVQSRQGRPRRRL
jgi:excisionase family DNA binding protein